MAKQNWKPGNMVYPLPAALISCGKTPDEHNLITVSWLGTLCTDPPMCYISVRPGRHSYDIIKRNGEFVINLTTVDMAKATDWCGVKSGRDFDKFAAAGLEKLPGVKVGAPMIAGAGLHYECKVVFKQPMNPEPLESSLKDAFYGNGDFHTLYFGRILATWQE